MKKTITIQMEADKISALRMYLGQKNMQMEDELEKNAEQLYQKYVPQNVREFIEMTAKQNETSKSKKAVPSADKPTDDP